jgi:hypothetical protein
MKVGDYYIYFKYDNFLGEHRYCVFLQQYSPESGTVANMLNDTYPICTFPEQIEIIHFITIFVLGI